MAMRPPGPQVGVLLEGGALDQAPLGGEDQVALPLEAPHGQKSRHLLLLGEGQEGLHVDSPGLAAHLRQVVDLEAVDPAPVAEDEEVVVGVGHEDVGGLVLLLGLARHEALAAPPLGPIGLQGKALQEALGGEGDDHGLVLNEVLGVEALLKLGDEGAPCVPVLFLDPEELPLDLAPEAAFVLQDGLEAGDLLHELPVFFQELLPLQGHQALEAHVQDGLGLGLGEAEALHEAPPGGGGVLGGPDQGDDLVDVVQGDEEALQDVGPLLGLLEVKEAPAPDHLLAVVQVVAHEV